MRGRMKRGLAFTNRTNQPDRPTDVQSYKLSHKDAWTHLKMAKMRPNTKPVTAVKLQIWRRGETAALLHGADLRRAWEFIYIFLYMKQPQEAERLRPEGKWKQVSKGA